MNKENNKKNKTYAVLSYFISLCFYVIAILFFTKDSTSTGVVFLCSGSTFLCLGSTFLNKIKDNKDDK